MFICASFLCVCRLLSALCADHAKYSPWNQKTLTRNFLTWCAEKKKIAFRLKESFSIRVIRSYCAITTRELFQERPSAKNGTRVEFSSRRFRRDENNYNSSSDARPRYVCSKCVRCQKADVAAGNIHTHLDFRIPLTWFFSNISRALSERWLRWSVTRKVVSTKLRWSRFKFSQRPSHDGVYFWAYVLII